MKTFFVIADKLKLFFSQAYFNEVGVIVFLEGRG